MSSAADRATDHALPAARPPRATLGGAVRGELHRLRRNRPTWVLSGLAVGFLAFTMALYATEGEYQQYFLHQPRLGFEQVLHPLQIFFAGGAGVILLISGARLLGMEYELGTLRVLLGRGTGRRQLVLAKLLALLAYAALALIGYWLLALLGLVVVVEHQTGSLAALGRLPVWAWQDAGLAVVSCALSEVSCALLGVALTALVRSVSAGLLLAVAFFPVDNGLAALLPQLARLTGSRAWDGLSAALLGPTLNRLPDLLQVHRMGLVSALPVPAVGLPLPESILVVAAWWLFLILAATESVARRDVLC